MKAIGRIFLSTIFILFGISAIYHWDEAYTDLDAAIVNLQMVKGNIELMGSFLDLLTCYITILLALGIFLQVVGGLLVFFGFQVKLGAVFLALYLFGSTLVYFPFWLYEGEQLTYYLVLFFKNVSILGGVLLLFGGSKRQMKQLILNDEL